MVSFFYAFLADRKTIAVMFNQRKREFSNLLFSNLIAIITACAI